MKMPRYLFPIILSLTLFGCSSSDNAEVTSEPASDTTTPDTMKPNTTTPDTMKPNTTTPDAMKPDTMKPDATIADTKKSVEPIPKEKVVPVVPVDSSIPVLTLSFTPTKAFHFTWKAVPGATSYKLTEAVSDVSGYKLVKEVTTTSFVHLVPLYARVNAKYILQSCIDGACITSKPVHTSTRVAEMESSIGYFKASNTDPNDQFGHSVSLSGDGNTLAVGAPYENGSATSGGENEYNNNLLNAGAVYVFTRHNTSAVWSQQVYLKAINADRYDYFGHSLSLSADGSTLAVGAPFESSDDTGPANNSLLTNKSGAVYVYTRSGTTWTQQEFLKANNLGKTDNFGFSVSLSANGNTLAVGARYEDGSAMSDGEDANNDAESNAGAVYVFGRTFKDDAPMWTQQKYLKASNAGEEDYFGRNVSLSADGHTLAVGAYGEYSSSTTIGTGQDNDTAEKTGAVYIFAYSNSQWDEQAYLKASNSGLFDKFGASVSISADGNTLAVGAPEEGSMATGVNNYVHQDDNSARRSGAAYVFIRNGADGAKTWSQQVYLKASNNSGAGEQDEFGFQVSISADGNTLAVGATGEGSDAVGVHNGDQTNSGASESGAVYTFTRSGATWLQQAYIKASNTDEDDKFGSSMALSANGDTLAVAAVNEDSKARGVNAADQTNSPYMTSGAVYLY